jgi:dipeptidyl aminopeptidase/acylaminoacyl peptidase
MRRYTVRMVATLCLSLLAWSVAVAEEPADDRFQPMDLFQLQYASDPQVSPDGKQIVYVRNSMDVQKDRHRSQLWTIYVDGSEHRPLGDGEHNAFSPRWSPDGKRLLYLSDASGSPQFHCRWLDTGQTAKLTSLPAAPGSPAWSPDGKWVAFGMFVEEPEKPFVDPPAKPRGAEWAEAPKVVRDTIYRFDGQGYLKHGYYHLFVVSADGGAPRQVTRGSFNHLATAPGSPPQTPAWSPDGKSILLAANRHADAEHDPLNSEIYELTVADGAIKALTDRPGPDENPVLSPDGSRIAYLGFDDKHVGYQASHLYVMNRDGTSRQVLAEKFDREMQQPAWKKDGNGLYVQYVDQGITKIGLVNLSGGVKTVAENVGGTEISRPYSSGSFSMGGDGVLAFTQTNPASPGEVAVRTPQDATARRLTALNENLLGHKALGEVEEIWYNSSHDGRKIQGWIVKPPHFDAKKKYPFILEIHGGPYADYGPSFSAEIQLYAAAGYVVLYTNPRGSTGYGEAFAQLINHAYPGNDYDDLMSGVDAVLKQGYVDEKNLFVTGGSGGGVLTAWIVGKTGRFRAAVSAKPCINWSSFALTSDDPVVFTHYWFPGPPWEQAEHYWKHSPLSLVGNVTTPTMLMTGEADYRTPISEAEQYYAALKVRKIDTALVRIPGASHAIVDRPSRLLAKVAHILKWFETHRHS